MDSDFVDRVLARAGAFINDNVIRRTRLRRVIATINTSDERLAQDVERAFVAMGIEIDEDEPAAEDLAAIDADAGTVVSEVIGEVPPQTPSDRAITDRLATSAPLVTGRKSWRDPTGDYLARIGAVRLLTATDEVALAKRIEAGLYAKHLLDVGRVSAPWTAGDLAQVVAEGARARNHMIESNLRLVVSIAKTHAAQSMEPLDLIQEGNMGLIHAVEMFDFTKGYKFSTYATWWIRQSITRGVADKSRTIRVPVHMVENIHRVWRYRDDLTVDGKPPTVRRLAKETGLGEEKVIECLRLGRVEMNHSFDEPLGDGEMTLGDLVTADPRESSLLDAVERDLLRDEMRSVLATLTDREAGVIGMRYGIFNGGEEKTLDEIGRVYGVTRERIRQVESKTLEKLRSSPCRNSLREFLYTACNEFPRTAVTNRSEAKQTKTPGALSRREHHPVPVAPTDSVLTLREIEPMEDVDEVDPYGPARVTRRTELSNTVPAASAHDLEEALIHEVITVPGSTAREISEAITRAGIPIRKSELNKILYRSPETFRQDGGAVPRWYLVDSKC